MSQLFASTFARVSLNRYPNLPHSPLQAFDAADEYLLNELASLTTKSIDNILILNDNFGALACSLANHYSITSSGDSHLAELALYNNLTTNQLTAKIQFIPSTLSFTGYYDVVLIRMPKTLALLEEQLIKLQPHITPNTIVMMGAMIKHLPRSTGELLEKYIGSVQASLAIKKARLLRVFPLNKPFAVSPYPTQYHLKEFDLNLTNHANVFCRESLDIGSRAFIPYLPTYKNQTKVADLGCGNGILGIIFAKQNPQAVLTFVDESYMAIASTKINWQQTHNNRLADINVTDGLTNQPPNSLDIVLCNPPFHQQQAIGDFMAKRMFKQAKESLKTQGELWIVGNRHLNYHYILKRLFGHQVTQIAQTSKFIILKAIK